MDIYKNKYLKYKNKYLLLKKQFGGNGFYFSVYVFTRHPLDQNRIDNMIKLLISIYGVPIEVIKVKEKSPIDGYYWNEAVRYIQDKSTNSKASYYKELLHVTSFVIKNVPKELYPMNDKKLTKVEYDVKSELLRFNLDSLDTPIIEGGTGDPEFSSGWGFYGEKLAIITLVEIA
jgi:hypothetical protein